MWRARCRSRWASHQTRLGEPAPRGRWANPYSLGEPVLIGRAIKRGWGEPSNEVGASQYSLGGRPASRPPRSSPGCPTYGSLTGKNRGGTLGFNHMHMQNRAKNQRVKMTCSKSCQAKNKLFHMSCKKTSVPHVMPCKKPHAKPCKKASCSTCCKNRAKTMQNAARTERQPAEPSQSPASLLYVLYVLYGSHKASH